METKMFKMKIERETLTELILLLFEEYGYDFRNYSLSHIERRVDSWLSKNMLTVSDNITALVKKDKALAHSLIHQFSISVTEMFRDPELFLNIREKVIPVLATYPFVRIWHAGCATGEEVYSMAILLKEEGILDKCKIYATDFNQSVLDTASKGIYPKDKMLEYTVNYYKSGGKKALTNYFESQYEAIIMNQELKQNIVWANHNLATDASFNEFHFIVCRNVLIYFNEELQLKVLQLFDESLVNHGFICLGDRESIKQDGLNKNVTILDVANKIYQLSCF
ncbi:MAG: protein-glutamate O-methyltransferase CheR [Crocinitomicaceae bacterium]|nr:protein-glutamate O-methyltransferase CheR [Crocinitomicaceae bacterium]